MIDSPLTTRFAPSPTGYLHLGHAYSAFIAAEHAERTGGTFYLRLEDIDRTRCTEAFATAVIEDVSWLGLRWKPPILKQSSHFPHYEKALETLRARGLLYPCFCTRKDIVREVAAAGGAPHFSPPPEACRARVSPPFPENILPPPYPGTCRDLPQKTRERRIAEGVPHAWRLDMQAALRCLKIDKDHLFWEDINHGKIRARPELFGDVVLARKDSPTSYHLSVTLDDDAQNITLITRGEDLFHATHVHRLLQALLGLETPLYHHHVLLCDSQGRRLAKRDGDITLRALRRRGLRSDDIRTMVEEKIDENT